MPFQWDPHLRQLLLEESEHGSVTGRRVGVIARLVDPEKAVANLETVVRVGNIVTGRVEVSQLLAVRRDPNVASLKRSLDYFPHDFEVDEEHLTRRLASTTVGQRTMTGRGVIIGFADWGFDFGHADFIDATGQSRFLWLWDQRGGRTPTSPEPYGYGRAWDTAAINRALAAPDPYAALGYDTAPLDRLGRGMHGTHTLGIVCGNGRARGSHPSAAPDASIIAVHLRGDDTSTADNLGDSSRIIEALDFIFSRAQSAPVVVNMSLGRCGGPHDCSPLVVRALDSMLEQAPRRSIVMSAGNYFATAQHASAQLRDGQVVEWQWEIEQPIGEVAELEIWYSSSDLLAVELLDPDGTVVCSLEPGQEHVERTGGQIVVSAFHRQRDPNNQDSLVDLFVWRRAMPGTWRVRIIPRHVERGEIHGWIERVSSGRQSRFVSADPMFTTNTICNGRHTIAVAAVDLRDPHRAPGRFSSAGPARDLYPKPDLAAPGVEITAAKSTTVINGERQRDGLATMSGTSMAAPHVTAAAALLHQASDRPLWADEIRALLCDSASPAPGATDRVGHGVLDIDAALRLLRDRQPSLATSSQGR